MTKSAKLYDSLTARQRIHGSHPYVILEYWHREGDVVLGYVTGKGHGEMLRARMQDRGEAGPNARVARNPEYDAAIDRAVRESVRRKR